VSDGLNIHKSESLVRLVAKACDIDIDLGEKGKQGILKNMESRTKFFNRVPAIFGKDSIGDLRLSWINNGLSY